MYPVAVTVVDGASLGLSRADDDDLPQVWIGLKHHPHPVAAGEYSVELLATDIRMVINQYKRERTYQLVGPEFRQIMVIP